MKVLQINAVYEKFSTGRTTKEMHEYFLNNGIESFVASPYIASLKKNAYMIGNKFDWKIHALFSRLTGLQGYFSRNETKKLINYIDRIKPDIIHLRNLHSNYINLHMLLNYISNNDIATVITLHDSWFYTGKCMYYIEEQCSKWKKKCGKCPSLKKGNPSFFFDCTKKMLNDKRKDFSKIDRLAVIGVSDWVTNDAKQSILHDAKIIGRIYNWIDLDLFKPRNTTRLREELNLNNKKVILGISMIWSPQKGINIFLEMANLLPDDYQIILVGNCDKNKYFNSKIMYLDTVENTKYLAQLYAMADIFVNPTIQDTFGKTTAEALSCGTPVVAYNCTAMPELIGINKECGELVYTFDAISFKKSIISVMKKIESGKKFMCRNRAITYFDKHKNIDMYLKLYNKLLDTDKINKE